MGPKQKWRVDLANIGSHKLSACGTLQRTDYLIEEAVAFFFPLSVRQWGVMGCEAGWWGFGSSCSASTLTDPCAADWQLRELQMSHLSGGRSLPQWRMGDGMDEWKEERKVLWEEIEKRLRKGWAEMEWRRRKYEGILAWKMKMTKGNRDRRAEEWGM